VVRSYPLYFWELVAGPTAHLQLPLFNRQVLCGMFIDYLSSIFISSSDEPDEEVDNDVHEPDKQPDAAHTRVVHTRVVHIQELHMYEPPSVLKSHDMSSTSMLLEKIILLISYIF
jgi:hypothetical protein